MTTDPATPVRDTDIQRLERPDSSLLVYYVLVSFVLGPFFPFLLLPLVFRYRTLRYRFDDEGVSMQWGALFRRQVHLTYARIQDIHLTSNVVERWLGLGRVQVQTASGSSKAEMTIEGLPEFEAVRDYLYRRMRGTREEGREGAEGTGATAGGLDGRVAEELATALLTVAGELRALRRRLEGAGTDGPPAAPPPEAG